jgi:hypothetical protein
MPYVKLHGSTNFKTARLFVTAVQHSETQLNSRLKLPALNSNSASHHHTTSSNRLVCRLVLREFYSFVSIDSPDTVAGSCGSNLCGKCPVRTPAGRPVILAEGFHGFFSPYWYYLASTWLTPRPPLSKSFPIHQTPTMDY